MKQRTAILLAMALTVFVLVLSGAIAMSVANRATAQDIAPQDPVGQAEAVSARVVNSPTATRARLKTRVPTTAPTFTPETFLAPERATKIALGIFPNSKSKRAPELVNYKGKMAYEVLLTRGTVYVDAFNGSVLGRIAILPPTPVPTLAPTDVPPPPSGGDSGGGNDSANDGSQQGSDPNPSNASAGPSQDPSGGGQNWSDDDGGSDDHGGDDSHNGGDHHGNGGNDGGGHDDGGNDDGGHGD